MESEICKALKFINIIVTDFYALPQKVAGYYVIPSELLSVCPSVCLSVRPSVRQRLNIRVRSITLIPFEIISRNLVEIKTVTPPTFFAELFPFEIFGIEIVSALQL